MQQRGASGGRAGAVRVWAAPLVDGAELEPGRYALTPLPGAQVSLEVPAGWTAWTFGVSPTDGGADPPAGVGLGIWTVGAVYRDVCRWDDAPPRPAGSTVGDVIRALESQQGRLETGPSVPAEVAGFQGEQLELALPKDLDFARCAQGEVRSWRGDPTGGRYQQGPGQIDQVTAIDVGTPELPRTILIHASWFPDSTNEDVAELQQIVASIEVSAGGEAAPIGERGIARATRLQGSRRGPFRSKGGVGCGSDTGIRCAGRRRRRRNNSGSDAWLRAPSSGSTPRRATASSRSTGVLTSSSTTARSRRRATAPSRRASGSSSRSRQGQKGPQADSVRPL